MMKKKSSIYVGIGIFLILTVVIVLNFNERNKTYRLRPGSINYEEALMEMNGKESKNSIASFGLGGYKDGIIYSFKSLEDGYEYYITENGVTNPIYTSHASAILCNQMYGDRLIICEFSAEEQMSFIIKQIGRRYEEILFRVNCSGMPTIEVIGDCLLVNYGLYNDGTVEQPLILYNLKTKVSKVIGSYSYFKNEKGNYDGNLLQAADGFDNGIIFEIISFNDEDINPDETGKPELFYYDFIEEHVQKLPIKLPRKLLYVTGDINCVITSDYASEMPLNDVGTIYILENGKYIDMKIPDIESGNDIIQAYRINNKVVALQTLNDIYLIDIGKKVYEKIANSNPIRANGKSIGYIGQDGNLNIYRFSD
ncbi:hypothetical protein ABFV83_08805 [Lacrimispora sp. BS-2]|uniref:Uncharacterized protein n=1 Tax=Lacrimispora sp. BS-2 TaxID=3151850 RepID=A0AAU7PTY8_9FIRM